MPDPFKWNGSKRKRFHDHYCMIYIVTADSCGAHSDLPRLHIISLHCTVAVIVHTYMTT